MPPLSKMQAVLIKDGKGPIENLYLGETDRPKTISRGQVLVKVKAFGLNRMDIWQRQGMYPVPPGTTQIMGVEFSGTVEDFGPDVTAFKDGDEVFGLAYGGAYAEYVLVYASMLLPKPSHLSWVEAAAVPEAWLTAFQALFLVAKFNKGEDILIHAGASGVGIAAIQLANHFGANLIITTAGSQEKLDFLKAMPYPPTHGVNYKTEDFAEKVKEATQGKGVDIVIDFVGKDYWTKNIASMAMDARLVNLALLSGGKPIPDFDLTPILYKRLHIIGTTLRSRSLEYQSDLIRQFNEKCMHDMTGEPGALKVYIHKVYKWTEIQDAHREMEENKNSGKIVVEIE